jgi:hypothetical protein
MRRSLRLAPARVVDRRVHVGIEAVLLGADSSTRSSAVFGEADAHDRLDALEAVFPRHHQRSGAPFWFGSRSPYSPTPAASADASPRRCAGPRDRASRAPGALAGHLLRAAGGELHVLRREVRLEALLQQRRQRKAEPRDHHRPAFDAAHPVDAFLERRQLHQLVEVEVRGCCAFALDPQTATAADENCRYWLAGSALPVPNS